MSKRNKVVRISLAGGIIGMLFTNPRKALDDAIDKENQDGWNAHQIQTHSTSNILIRLLQLAVLVCTLGIWTWGAGYLILFEKENTNLYYCTKLRLFI